MTGPWFELRPDRTDFGMELDEIVAEGCTGFHMEAMDKDCYWLCLDFPNGERLTWRITLQPKRRRLMATVAEEPSMRSVRKVELRETRKGHGR